MTLEVLFNELRALHAGLPMEVDLGPLEKNITNLDLRVNAQAESLAKLDESLFVTEKALLALINENDVKSTDFQKKALKLFIEMKGLIDDLKLSYLQIQGRGGNANRKLSINGSVVSTRYTDINFKGSGVTYTAVDNNTTREVDLTLGVSGQSPQTPTGTVDGGNQTFVFGVAPLIIFRDGAAMQKISSGGNVNWTGTTTVVLQVAPNFDIFGL